MSPSPPEPLRTPTPRSWWLLAWLTLLFSFLLYAIAAGQLQSPTRLSYSEFKDEVRSGRVAEVTFRGQRIEGVYHSMERSEEASAPTRFVTTRPPFEDPSLISLLEASEVAVQVQEESNVGPFLLNLLPFILILAFFLYSSLAFGRRMGEMGGRLTGFGKSKARRYERGTSGLTFRDVAGLDNAKRELREITAFLRDPSRFQRLGANVPTGVLLMGPPGTGKTLLAKACAGEAEVPFFSISGSEFVEMFVGVGASRVRDMFADAKREAPAIIFIDEIDSVGRARGTGLGGGHDEREQTLNQILAEMDGFSSEESVVVMAATNRPDVLDSALLRPGRFDRKITLELPQRRARRQILEVHTRQVPVADEVDLDDIAARTVGFSGADLENLVNEAALLAARLEKEHVESDDFEQARDRILLGGEREDLIVEDEKRLVAYHESGHALVAHLLPGTDPLKKVTIIPRGRSLGATEQQPQEDRHNVSRSYLLNRLAVMLGGRAAERLVFDDLSTGAEDDLKQVSALARRMVGQWGMSERLGPVTFRLGEEHVFLGREMAQAPDYSERTAQIIDEEIRTILDQAEERARQVLEDHRAELEALAAALLEHETLEVTQIDALVKASEAGKLHAMKRRPEHRAVAES